MHLHADKCPVPAQGGNAYLKKYPKQHVERMSARFIVVC